MSLKYIKSERGTNILANGGTCTSVNAISQKKAFGDVCNTNKNVEEEFMYLMVK